MASWDPAARTVTFLAGGEDGDVDVGQLGLAARGLGPQVRVRVDCALWTTDPLAADRRADRAGDPRSAPYNVYDKVLTLDGGGHLTVPIRRMERLNGYRITVQPVSAPAVYAGKYEAEAVRGTNTVSHLGSDTALASGRGYVGGIDRPTSAVEFSVDAPRAGAYLLDVGYANSLAGAADHVVTVDGTEAGRIDYPTTGAWLGTAEQDAVAKVATVRVTLREGTNHVRLSRGQGYAELDWAALRAA
ncbi:hypothetical protein OHT61_28595 [Streptomyces sp. NBC_00178]|uniref:CBM35 domain-containing protein n=1 Tax=Streptomyces sp. NBC_00178 TaxID=2975672 RepID=UPI002E2BAD0D|nr:CBM35 domain-containing protein [Streptomyces sp. NBC_00178]